MCKWGLVLAALKDLGRPAELLSAEQCAAVGATGYIYSRFSMVIIPKNYTLLSVNVFVAITQTIQVFRALNYKYQHGELFAKPKVDEEWGGKCQHACTFCNISYLICNLNLCGDIKRIFYGIFSSSEKNCFNVDFLCFADHMDKNKFLKYFLNNLMEENVGLFNLKNCTHVWDD